MQYLSCISHFAQACRKKIQTEDSLENGNTGCTSYINNGQYERSSAFPRNERNYQERTRKKQIKEIQIEDEDEDQVFVDTVETSTRKCWHQEMIVNESKIKFKLDSGAESSILPMKYLKNIDENSYESKVTPN